MNRWRVVGREVERVGKWGKLCRERERDSPMTRRSR